MNHYLIVATCVSSLLVSACSTPHGPNEQTDTLIGVGGGALAGGLIGSAFGGSRGAVLGVGLGALAGGMMGNQIGKSQDQEQTWRYRDDNQYYPDNRYYPTSYDDGYYDRGYDNYYDRGYEGYYRDPYRY
jgi:uncharacterized protein YcfJ